MLLLIDNILDASSHFFRIVKNCTIYYHCFLHAVRHAVSYTHLDVYKRQPVGHATAAASIRCCSSCMVSGSWRR